MGSQVGSVPIGQPGHWLDVYLDLCLQVTCCQKIGRVVDVAKKAHFLSGSFLSSTAFISLL